MVLCASSGPSILSLFVFIFTRFSVVIFYGNCFNPCKIWSIKRSKTYFLPPFDNQSMTA